MALKLRRGTENERISTVFEEGEPVYVTDTGDLYIGDGTTAGGQRVSDNLELDTSPSLGGNLDLNNFNIEGIGNINIDGNINATGNIELGNGVEDNISVGGQITSSLIPDSDSSGYDLGAVQSTWRTGYFESIISQNGEFTDLDVTDLIVSGNLDAAFFIGDIAGTVFADDSSIMVDGLIGVVRADTFVPNNNLLNVTAELGEESEIALGVSSLENPSIIRLTRNSTIDLPAAQPFSIYGNLQFERNDVNGEETVAFLNAGHHYITLAASPSTAGLLEEKNRITFYEQKLGVGVANPQTTIDVNGSATINGFVQFGLFTDADRPSGSNGQIIYNTTVNRFQGYQNDGWINLDDGSPA